MHSDTLRDAGNVASAKLALGDWGAARGIHEAVLNARLQLLGPVHRSTLLTVHNLAMTLKRASLHEESAAVCTRAIRAAAEALNIDSTAVAMIADLPLLEDPETPFPSECVSELLDLLPKLSVRICLQLRPMPLDSGAALYGALVHLHHRWLWFVLRNVPAEPDLILSILSPLHGVYGWSQLRELAQSRTMDAADGQAQEYLTAELAITQTRAELNSALERRNELRQQAADNEFYLAAALRAAAVQPGAFTDQQLASSRQGLSRLRAEIGESNQRLQSLHKQDQEGHDKLRAAEKALSTSGTSIPGGILDVGRSVTRQMIEASMNEEDLWIVTCPEPRMHLDPDPAEWGKQVEGNLSFIYALRPGHTAVMAGIWPLQMQAAASRLYSDSLRTHHRGALRGGVGTKGAANAADEWLPPQSQSLELDFVREVAYQGFWKLIGNLLQGVRRIHLVTSAGLHGHMLECGQPPEHSDVCLLRYCGIPAYLRRAGTSSDATHPRAQYSWVHDASPKSDCPIPFTVLDAFVPGRRRRGSEQSPQALIEHGPHHPILLVASHGQVSGARGSGSGCLLIGDFRLDAHALVRQRQAWRTTQGLVTFSCFAGAVGVSAEGDAHGLIAALQANGLHWAIACLTPVSDFHSPLFSAILHHRLDIDIDPANALLQAKRVLMHGPWDAELVREVIDPLRGAYAELMLELLERMRHVAGDEPHNERARALMTSLTGWTLPGRYRRMMDSYGSVVDVRSAHHVIGSQLPNRLAARQAFVDECLKILFTDPATRSGGGSEIDELVQLRLALEELCASTVFFGKP